MSQDDTPDLAAPQADKVAPEAVALRAQPRPVTRLNRRSLAILAGVLAVAVLGALLELSGEKASPVEVAVDEPIDAVWEEPVVFDGCSSKGQARPDQAQTIRIVPHAARQADPFLGAQK